MNTKPLEIRVTGDIILKMLGFFCPLPSGYVTKDVGHTVVLRFNDPDRGDHFGVVTLNRCKDGEVEVSLSVTMLEVEGGEQPDPEILDKMVQDVLVSTRLFSEEDKIEEVDYLPGTSINAHHRTRRIKEDAAHIIFGAVILADETKGRIAPKRPEGVVDIFKDELESDPTALNRWAYYSECRKYDTSRIGALDTFHHTGENVVVLDASLQAALERTDPPEEDLIPAPFHSFLLQLATPVDGSKLLLAVPREMGQSVLKLLDWEHKSPDMYPTDVQARLFGNVVYYINNVDQGESFTNAAEVEKLHARAKRRHGKKAEKAQKRADNTPVVTTVKLGYSFKLDQGPRIHYDEAQKRQHWVRGHWRNQAHGHKRALRTMRWIQPHVRCKDSPRGKVQGKVYTP